MRRVIKLGGSLLKNGAMQSCLDAIAAWSGTNWVVTGGGAFADQIRKAQMEFGFDELAAHRSAILAMQQTAYCCHSFNSLFVPTQDWRSQHHLALWLPDNVELERAGVLPSWDITSDSLAVWLATQLQADQLIVVKSAPIHASDNWRSLQAQGILDAAFDRFITAFDHQLTFIHYQHLSAYDPLC